MQNRIDASLSAADVQEVITAINTIKNKLPFLIGLDPKEFQRLPKMDNARYPFVKQALTLAENNPKLAPQFYDLGEAEKDLALCESLDEVSFLLDELNTQLIHTRALAGSEAYVVALSVYDTAKRGAAKGVEGMDAAANQLKTFFEGQGASKPKV